MLYYYANTGHKIGLERLRRGVALLKKLEQRGEEVMYLVNDFRAGLIAKGLGLKDYVTVESVQDIDAIATGLDSIIIDSTEDDHGRLVKYCADFRYVFRFAHGEEDCSIHGEKLFKAGCDSDECLEAMIIDDRYYNTVEKEERTLFFLGDADYDKVILNNASFFEDFEMEILLGNYFFVKYEDDLAKLFTILHEPEEYRDLIENSTTLVTASAQAAVEARANGTKVIFLNIMGQPLYPMSLLSLYGIVIVDGFDSEKLKMYLTSDLSGSDKLMEKYDDKKIDLKH